jgi:pimeloyl-ACP methyl ester carboxylesterase
VTLDLDTVSGVLDVAGTPTHVIDTGEPAAGADGPPVLLLHGSGPGVSALANWRLVIPALAATRRVIAPDQLGFGRTADGSARAYGRAAWTGHAVALLDALDVDEVDVVGNSMGGAIALSLAAAQPRRVRRQVLMGTVGVAMPLPPGLDEVWAYEPSLEAMERVMRLFTDDDELITGDLIRLRLEGSLVPTVAASWAAMFPAPRQRWVDDLALTPDELRAITVPTLLIHGRDDHVIPLASSLELLATLPHADLHVLGSCGHWTMIERTPEFLAQVTTHLRG